MEGNNTDLAQSLPNDHDLSTVLVSLLKGVIYREDNARLWSTMLRHQIRVREFVEVLGLELILDDTEGFAFLTIMRVAGTPDDETYLQGESGRSRAR